MEKETQWDLKSDETPVNREDAIREKLSTIGRQEREMLAVLSGIQALLHPKRAREATQAIENFHRQLKILRQQLEAIASDAPDRKSAEDEHVLTAMEAESEEQ